MAEQVVTDLKEEVEKRRFKMLCRKLDDIRDILAINNLQNTMLLRGMDKLIVQKLGVAFLNEYENKQLLKQIDDILVGMNKRNGVTQQELQEKIAEFQTTFHTVGNMTVLPDKRSDEWSINKHRGC